MQVLLLVYPSIRALMQESVSVNRGHGRSLSNPDV